jgi:CRP-like cAMP-binding protein
MNQHQLALKAIIDKLQPLEAETFDLLFASCFHQHFKKGKVILNEGELDQNLRFVLRGVVKSYKIVDSENMSKESINWIIDEGNIACSVVSLFNNEASAEYLEAIEDSDLITINIESLKKLMEQRPAICMLINKWVMQYLVMYDKRIDMYRNSKPERRLQIFMAAQPTLIKRLSKKEIASYLDIAPGTLSAAFHKI